MGIGKFLQCLSCAIEPLHARLGRNRKPGPIVRPKPELGPCDVSRAIEPEFRLSAASVEGRRQQDQACRLGRPGLAEFAELALAEQETPRLCAGSEIRHLEVDHRTSPTAQPCEGCWCPRGDARVRAIEQIESFQLAKADQPIEVPGASSQDIIGKSRVATMIGPGTVRQQLDRDLVRQFTATILRKERYLVTTLFKA